MTSLISKAKEFREWASPTLKSSAFLTRGVLTPEEFVKAGDELVFKCPTWSWEGGDPSRARPYLPPGKQYLLTRNVPCANRAKSMEDSMLGETVVDISLDLLYTDADQARAGKGGDGWLISHHNMASMQKNSDNVEEDDLGCSKLDEFDVIDIDESKNGGMIVTTSTASSLLPSSDNNIDESNSASQAKSEDCDDSSEYGDMDDFEDNNILQDDAAVMAISSAPQMCEENGLEFDGNIIKTRTYDLSITYDKYYQTPRIWMMGYAEDGISILSDSEMFDDVISDYVKRTVTIENHPHVCGNHMSIHPCQHGAVMKNIVRNLMKDSNTNSMQNTPEVESYLFIFLKFVSSIIPTINYDFTMDVTASTRKG